MVDEISPDIILQMAGAQGCAISSTEAAQIAATLGAQLRAAAPGYDALAFEIEPSGFEAAQRLGAIR